MPKDYPEGSHDDERLEVASVVEWAGDQTAEKNHERLDGADPADVGRGDGTGRLEDGTRRLVVGLENAEGVEETPGVEEDEEGGSDLEPGGETAVWWWGPRRECGGRWTSGAGCGVGGGRSARGSFFSVIRGDRSSRCNWGGLFGGSARGGGAAGCGGLVGDVSFVVGCVSSSGTGAGGRKGCCCHLDVREEVRKSATELSLCSHRSARKNATKDEWEENKKDRRSLTG